ncbi:hypothetical protein O6H91_08G071200 [Diphasiastrum complanatum]|uniref:Uncharacterized protein n=1 Tax=Diphasiastrum complanatum TaxID=34168 RepID=A0ACC2CYQ2_DIPCM|nr:hypothetical protein O6H91_Y345400 [Diphasiastrum complanatum]KAJ7547136.1 hypothetical protein O6H91_08G071200 [Diphasiastrum complanatum]
MAKGREICLVTGGRGFVAQQLVQKLVESERWMVRIMDLAPRARVLEEELLSPLQEAFLDGEAEYVSADLRNRHRVFEACKGVTVVFHMAAPDSSINEFKLHYDVTVTGTRNIIDACVHFGVKKLVYTSSPSVVFDGEHGIYNADESLPYPDKYNDYYSETKAQAEALVLKANGKGGLATCAIRPSGIFGPGDRLLLPTLVNAAKSGKLKFVIGDGQNVFDWTYVENVAHAHICAEQALIPGASGDNASGKAYFITNCEPRKFWDFVGEFVEQLGYERPTIHLPVRVVMPLAYLVEWASKQLAPLGVPTTHFTPSRIRLVTSWRSFNCARATKYLNYAPPVTLEEGIRRTVEAFFHLRAEVQESRHTAFPSRAHSQLGGGKAADLLLWRNWKKTFGTLFSIYVGFYFFFRSGYTLIFVAARTMMLLLVIAYFYRYLQESILDHRLPEIPATLFEISEDKSCKVVLSAISWWNHSVTSVQLMVTERNWYQFFKILVMLRVMKIFGKFSAEGFVNFGLFAIFSAPFMYEQNEQEINIFIDQICNYFHEYRDIALSKLSSIPKEDVHKG